MVRASSILAAAAIFVATPAALAAPSPANNIDVGSYPKCDTFLKPKKEIFVDGGMQVTSDPNVYVSNQMSESSREMVATFKTNRGLVFVPANQKVSAKYYKVGYSLGDSIPAMYVKTPAGGPCQVEDSKDWVSVTNIQLFKEPIAMTKRELMAEPSECQIVEASDEDGTYVYDKKAYKIVNGSLFTTTETVPTASLEFFPAVTGVLDTRGLVLTPSADLKEAFTFFVEYTAKGDQTLKTKLIQTFTNESCVVKDGANWSKITKVNRARFFAN